MLTSGKFSRFGVYHRGLSMHRQPSSHLGVKMKEYITPTFLPTRERALVLRILRAAQEQQKIEIDRLEGLRFRGLKYIENGVITLTVLQDERKNLEHAIKLLWGVRDRAKEHEGLLDGSRNNIQHQNR